MKQLIDKSAVVAEIDKRINFNAKLNAHSRLDECNAILSFINNLEVKEVDLKKELNNFIEQQNAFVKDDRVVEYDNGDSFNHIYDLEEIAKHFFELGLKAQKGRMSDDKEE